MPSVFTLQGPFGNVTSGAGTNLGGTTTAGLNLLTATPQNILTILEDMASFLRTGAKNNLPVAILNPSADFYIDKGKVVNGKGTWPYKMGFDDFVAGSFLWVSHDLFKLWDHALKRSKMSGGLAQLPLPSSLANLPIMLPDFFSGDMMGYAENQLIGVEGHVKALEKQLGVGGGLSRTVKTGLGVAAGVLVLVGIVALTRPR